jgi:hypothetical protein
MNYNAYLSDELFDILLTIGSFLAMRFLCITPLIAVRKLL